MNVTSHSVYTKNSYRGAPDLGLAVAIVEAGGGSKHFDGKHFVRTLAAGHTNAEMRRLERLYGKGRIEAFIQTLTFSVRDTQQILSANHVSMPRQPRVSPRDGRALTLAIYHDGIMPTGKFDCGYMMEHIMTHRVHVAVMRDIDQLPAYGRTHNANFHTILTRVILDLKNDYARSV
ncbi:MAG: hypothetical protein ACXVAM_16090 [Vulcanimicrobiaceae bacterium]